MKKLWSKLKNTKNSRYLMLIPALVLVVLIVPNTAHAGFFDFAGNAVAALLSAIPLAIIGMLGALMQVVMYLFVAIAQYDGFATAPAISLGWSMIRDLCNMAIVGYLLYIAFRYALGLSHSELDKDLVSLVLVAIGVNFSKTITLLLVDISQVVMLTFVNSFKNIGVAELYRIMNVGSYFTPSSPSGPAVELTVTAALSAQFFTIIILIVILTVLFVFMAILIVRVVMIWLHIVLSPIFIAGFGISWLKAYHDTWKKEMTELLIIGPCLAFFIWLTFASMQATSGSALIIPNKSAADKLKANATAGEALGPIGAVDTMTGIFVSLALLLGGLTLCSKYASTIPGGFDKALKSIADTTKSFLSAPAGYAKSFGKGIAKGVGDRAYNNKFLKTLTARGSKELNERLEARGQVTAGGKYSARAVQNVQEKQQEAKNADFKLQGAMDNKGEFKKRYDMAIKEGKAEDIKALLKAGATKGWVDDKMFEEAKPIISSSFGMIAGAAGWARDKAKGYGVSEEDLEKIGGLGVAGGSRERAGKAELQFLNEIAKISTNPLDAGEKSIDSETGEVMEGAKTKAERMQERIKKMSMEDIKKAANVSDSLMGDNAAAKISGFANKAEQMGKLDQDERDKVKKQLENLKKQEGFVESLTKDEAKDMDKLFEAVNAKWDSNGNRKIVDGVTSKGGSLFTDTPPPAEDNIAEYIMRTKGTKDLAEAQEMYDNMNDKQSKAVMREAVSARNKEIDSFINDPNKVGKIPKSAIDYERSKQDTADMLNHSKGARAFVQGVFGGIGSSIDGVHQKIGYNFNNLKQGRKKTFKGERGELQKSGDDVQIKLLNNKDLLSGDSSDAIDDLFIKAKGNFDQAELGMTADIKDPLREVAGVKTGESVTRGDLIDRVQEQIQSSKVNLKKLMAQGLGSSDPDKYIEPIKLAEAQLKRQIQDAVLLFSPDSNDNKKYQASNSYVNVPPARIESINTNLETAKKSGNEIAAAKQINSSIAEVAAMLDQMRARGANTGVIKEMGTKLEGITRKFETNPNRALNEKVDELKKYNAEVQQLMKSKGFFAREV